VADLRITPGDQTLARYGNAMAILGDYGTRQVLARALNRTGGPMLTAVRRALRDQTSAPMAIIRKQVVARKAWAGTAMGAGKLEFAIVASGRPLSLAYFNPRETRQGVRAKVWGAVQTYPGMFMKGGRFPKRVAAPELRGQVFVRADATRLPIERTFGPALPKELVQGKAREAFDQGVERLGRDIDHELYRALPA
jgi:hypothetical protein